MASAPREFLPVVLGHGCFMVDRSGRVKRDSKGQILYIIPIHNDFLKMAPSLAARQYWPRGTAKQVPRKTSVVLLIPTINTACNDQRVVTKVGYTMFDRASVYHRIDKTVGGPRKPLAGCLPPGIRGENIFKFGTLDTISCQTLPITTRQPARPPDTPPSPTPSPSASLSSSTEEESEACWRTSSSALREPVESELAASELIKCEPTESETAQRKRNIREAELNEQYCVLVEKRLRPDDE
ncbi:Uu.00g142790.m01.CDS01 [Anthostomella pinea]|uniref:Uu.00g142790.m01.CDS01 n=1 Tax=Anthostomella pinea TaxID=933095 RepID=A0AAI8VRG0_9PEZI|nr:Uu.00g142790.m01.CDS01 [Anthostomella pinea]